MHIKRNELLTSVRWSISYLIVIPIIVCFFIILIGLERIDEFEQAHYRIAESTTTIVANEISKQIKNQQRLLSVLPKMKKS